MQRTKGRRAQCEFAKLLTSRDWEIVETSCGHKVEDIVAHDPQGNRWSIEVKHHKLIDLCAFMQQARMQAAIRKIPWMLAVRLPRYPAWWLILRQDVNPTVWHETPRISHEDAPGSTQGVKPGTDRGVAK